MKKIGRKEHGFEKRPSVNDSEDRVIEHSTEETGAWKHEDLSEILSREGVGMALETVTTTFLAGKTNPL